MASLALHLTVVCTALMLTADTAQGISCNSFSDYFMNCLTLKMNRIHVDKLPEIKNF